MDVGDLVSDDSRRESPTREGERGRGRERERGKLSEKGT